MVIGKQSQKLTKVPAQSQTRHQFENNKSNSCIGLSAKCRFQQKEQEIWSGVRKTEKMFSLVIRSLAGELIYFSPHIFMFRQYQNRSFITILDIPLPQPPDWNGTRILLYKVTFRTVHFPKCSKNIYLNTRNNFLQKSFQIKIFSEERTNPARCDVMYLKYLIV